MSEIQYFKMDLFEALSYYETKHVVIPHICNNKGAWGAGFVIPLGKAFPDAKEKYLYYHDILEGGLPLGGVIYSHNHGDNVTVANMVAQTLGGKRPLYYNYLSKCMDDVAKHIKQPIIKFDKEVIIVCPKFGSGLAGGNWEIIKELIHDCWLRRGISVDVYSID